MFFFSSTTPTSSKYKSVNRVPLKDVKNMRDSLEFLEKNSKSRKRSSNVFSEYETLNFESFESFEDENDSQKRRCDQTIFQHDDDVYLINFKIKKI